MAGRVPHFPQHIRKESPMNGHWITIPTSGGAEYSGYLSLPPTGTGPGIVLLQEIWGVNNYIRNVADQFALAGFVVLAPDVFWRMAPRVDLDYDEAGNAQAFGYYQKIDTAQAVDDIADAARALRKLPQVTGKIATLGYCLGGQLAYRTGATGTVDAVVSLYGGGIDQHLDLAGKITIPAQFHHADDDSHITPDKVGAIKAAFAGKANAAFFDYAGVGHAFSSWGRPAVYNQRAAALAHGRALEFLAQNL
jgi:carboxymethylenebutenolidase